MGTRNPTVNARQIALEALEAVMTRGVHLGAALDEAGARCADGRERALARELGYGVARWSIRLTALRAALVRKKPKPVRLDLILQLGLYQLEYTRIPPHAAVSATVQLARANRLQHASGLVNAALRRFKRERQQLNDAVDEQPAARHAHPDWWLQMLADDWPDAWPAIVAANNARAPLTLRVNERRISREAYLEQLDAADISAEATRHAPSGIRLGRGIDPTKLPGFAAGHFSVQDAAGQLVADVMRLERRARVLDACAAPGGKSGALLERYDGIELHAIDNDEKRVGRLRENLHRLGLTARIEVADAARPHDWWDGQPYDAIVLDVPCTASGIVRRHPDVRLARTPEDVTRNHAQQVALLRVLWPLLAPGGQLLYATCSVFATENRDVTRVFVEATGDAEAVALTRPWGTPSGAGVQVLPGEADMDGFFYALLRKRATC